MFMSSLKNKFAVFVAKLANRCFCWFPSAMLVLIQVGTSMTSSDISYTKYSSDLNLGEGLCIFTSFHFPDSGLYLLNGFDFYFDRL